MTVPARIILTGFSGTGKSAVAPIVAAHFGWQVIDTDPIIEKRAGKPILDIFRDDGEAAFRDLEAEALKEACRQERVVLSTGGGAVLRSENRRAMAEGGFIVCLEARPQTILARLNARSGEEPLDRPLLATANPLERITELKSARQPLYALCDWAVQTDAMTPEDIAAEIVRAYERLADGVFSDSGRIQAITAPDAPVPARTLHDIPPGAACMVSTLARQYPVFVGWGTLSELARRLRDAGLARHVYLVSDEHVFHHLGDEAETALRAAEVAFDSYLIPPGEASKSQKTVSDLYDWLVQHKAERGHTVVALGGGVVTDLAGFAAATYARGMPLVHVPTSLLGMVDAAIGGKVGVNHPQAKNMIGAFHQPRFVLADAATLRTLPPRDVYSGWAEVIKHGFIADESLVRFLEDQADPILRLDREPTTEAIRRSVCIKADVVSRDEFETLGPRTTLNYGHTLAHAIEATTGYTRYLHGEAISVGMTAAAAMSVRIGFLSPEVAERQGRLLERYHLPVRAEGLDRDRLRAAMSLDKKVQGKAIRWVLLETIGKPLVRDDVPPEVVEAGLDAIS
jgi:shikimate kinase/3-dehydroquinate synthase